MSVLRKTCIDKLVKLKMEKAHGVRRIVWQSYGNEPAVPCSNNFAGA